jgi:aspartyl-tRNA(Asn)/glutamyl-tRNA(Gln) amidotransferase subunit C
MKISREEVKHIALLARIATDESEIEKFQHQLSDILDNFEVLQQVDTADLPATAQSIPLLNVFRNDEPKPSCSVEEILSNAPQRIDTYFKVQAVLE